MNQRSFPQYVTQNENAASYGDGWIGGNAPDDSPLIDGRTKVNGEIKPLVVKAINVNTNVVTAQTKSAEDGTWRLHLVDPKQRYQVVFQNDSYLDGEGVLYNSFVQDFINGVPYERGPYTAGYTAVELPVPRYTAGRTATIFRQTIPGKPPVEIVNPPAMTVTPGVQNDKGVFAPTNLAPGEYSCQVKYVGYDQTVSVPYTVVPQNTFKQARLYASIHPESASPSDKTIRRWDGVYNNTSLTNQPLTEPARLANNDANTISAVRLSDNVRLSFIGGGAIGDNGFDIGDFKSADPGSPMVLDFWVYISSYPEAGKLGSLVMISPSVTATLMSPYKYCYVDSTGALFWDERGGTNASRVVTKIPDATLPIGNWIHIQYQQDETAAKNSQVFVNGVMKHSWQGISLNASPLSYPMNSDSPYAVRAIWLMSSGKYQHPEVANIVWLEGYMAKVQLHSGYQGCHENFDVAPLKNERVSRLTSSLVVAPFNGGQMVNRNATKLEPTGINTGYTHDENGLSFSGSGGVSIPVPWNNYSQCIEFFMFSNNRDPTRTVATITSGPNDGGLNNGGLRIQVSGGRIFGEFAKLINTTQLTTNSIVATGDGFIADGSWVHVALTYDALTGTARMFYQGVLMGEASYASQANAVPTYLQAGSQYYLTLGCGRAVGDKNGSAAMTYFSGNIRGLRMTQGHPRYTAPFTPPTYAALIADQIPCQWSK